MLRQYFDEASVFDTTFIRASLVFLENADPEKVDLVVYCMSCDLEEAGELLSAVDVRASVQIRKEMHNALVRCMRKHILGLSSTKWKNFPYLVQNMMGLSAELLIEAHTMIEHMRPIDREGISRGKIAEILLEYCDVLELNIPKGPLANLVLSKIQHA